MHANTAKDVDEFFELAKSYKNGEFHCLPLAMAHLFDYDNKVIIIAKGAVRNRIYTELRDKLRKLFDSYVAYNSHHHMLTNVDTASAVRLMACGPRTLRLLNQWKNKTTIHDAVKMIVLFGFDETDNMWLDILDTANAYQCRVTTISTS